MDKAFFMQQLAAILQDNLGNKLTLACANGIFHTLEAMLVEIEQRRPSPMAQQPDSHAS